MENGGGENDSVGELFDQFCHASTCKHILTSFQQLCDAVGLRHADHRNFYRKIRARITTWKAQSLWLKLDKRATNKEYKRGEACANTRVIVIGGGICGLRVAIEVALLGARCVVVEKRDRFSRNNVLHLWPFLITDLKNLGAKKFFGKFCAGAIDHISIRQLQCILLKVALVVGVEVHTNVGFVDVIEPTEPGQGWRVLIDPVNHPLSEYEFDVLIGADGKRNTLQGFKRKEFRGKLAIAITANFINRNSQAEARVEEISGVAFIFNQKFFKDLNAECNIDLENIVYYKDETHYFVMTAKKQSLLEKGVLKQDYADTAMLLARENVNQDALANYAREAADFSTNHMLPHLDFAVNHYGQADLAMFDFTSLFQAENATRVIERQGKKLLMMLVGDSLLEPFWPTGSGCARGFLGAFDGAWMIKNWSSGVKTPLQVIAERESIYQLLSQTTPENLQKNYNQYTLDPASRYTNMKAKWLKPRQVMHLYDTGENTLRDEIIELPSKFGKDDVIDPYSLLRWSQKILNTGKYHTINITDLSTSWRNGLAFCALVHYFKPDVIDYESLNEDDIVKNNQLAFDKAQQEFSISAMMSGEDIYNSDVPDKLKIISYLIQFHDLFKKQRPPSEEIMTASLEESRKHRSPSHRMSILAKIRSSRVSLSKLKKSIKKENNPTEDAPPGSIHYSSHSYNINNNYDRIHAKTEELLTRPDKRHLANGNVELTRYNKLPMEEISSKLNVGGPRNDGKDVRMREEMMPVVKVSKMAEILVSKFQSNCDQPLNTPITKRVKGQPMMVASQPASEFCFFCKKRVYIMERMSVENVFFHNQCFKCDFCDTSLRANTYTVEKNSYGDAKRFFCARHATPVSRFGRPARKRVAEDVSDVAKVVPSSNVEGTGPPPSKVSAGSKSPKKSQALLSPDSSSSEPSDSLKTPERIEFENTIEGLPEETEEDQYEHNLSMSMTRDGHFNFPDMEECARNSDESDSSDSDLEELLSEMDVSDYEEVAHMLQSWDEGDEFQEAVDLYNSGRLEESICLAKESLRRSQENLFEDGYQRLNEDEEEEEDTEVEYTEEEYETEDSDTEMEEEATEPSTSNNRSAGRSDPHTSTPSSTSNKPRSTGVNTAVSQESRANFFTSPAEPLRLDPFKMFGMPRKTPVAMETEVTSPTEEVKPVSGTGMGVGEMESDEGTDSQVGSGVLDNKAGRHENHNTEDECEEAFLNGEHMEPVEEDEETMEKTAVSRAMEQLLFDMDNKPESLSDNNDPVLKGLSGEDEEVEEEGDDDVFQEYRKQLSSVDSLSANEDDAGKSRSRSSGDFEKENKCKTSSGSDKSGSDKRLIKGSVSGSEGPSTGSDLGATERSVLRSIQQMTGKSSTSGNGETTLEVLRSVEKNGESDFKHLDDKFVTRTRGSSRKQSSKHRSKKHCDSLHRSDSSDSFTISTPSQASSRRTSSSSLGEELEYNKQYLVNESDDEKPDADMLRDYQLTMSHALGEDSDELSPRNNSPAVEEDLDQTINAEDNNGATSPKSEYLSPRSDLGEVSAEFGSPRSDRKSSSVYETPNSSMEPEMLAKLKSEVSPPVEAAVSEVSVKQGTSDLSADIDMGEVSVNKGVSEVCTKQDVSAGGKKKKMSTAKKIKKKIKSKMHDFVDPHPVLAPNNTNTIIRPSRAVREGSVESNHLERNEWGSSNSSLNSVESNEQNEKKSWRPLPPLPIESESSPVQSKTVRKGGGRVLPDTANLRPISPPQAFQSNFMKKLYSSNGDSSSELERKKYPEPSQPAPAPAPAAEPKVESVITAQPRPLPRRPAVKRDRPDRPVMKKASEYCTMARPQEKIGVLKPVTASTPDSLADSADNTSRDVSMSEASPAAVSELSEVTSPVDKVELSLENSDLGKVIDDRNVGSCKVDSPLNIGSPPQNKVAEKTKVSVDYTKLKIGSDKESGSDSEVRKKRIPVAVSLKQSLKPKLSGTSNTSVEEASGDIPFADDSDHDGNDDEQFFTPATSMKQRQFQRDKGRDVRKDVRKRILPEPPKSASAVPNAHHIRDLRKAEIEKAREEARDRARLKSDEELGIKDTPYKRTNSSDNNYESSTSNPPERVSDSDYFMPKRKIPAISFTPEIPASNGTPTRSKDKKKKKKTKDRDSSTGLSNSGENLDSGTKREKKKKSILASLLSNVKTTEKSKDIQERDRSSSTDNLEDSVVKKKKLKTPKTDKKKEKKKRKTASLGTEEVLLSKNMEGLKIGAVFTEKSSRRPAFRRNMLPPKASVDDFTDSDEDIPSITASVTSLNESRRIKSDHGPLSEDELNARITRKIQHAARKQQKQQEQKRLRQAQEIQRKLQEVDVKQRELEERGVTVERGLRQEGPLAGKQEADLMQMWFNLVREKNALVRSESELMVNARELELEDRQGRLQQQLRESIALDDSIKSPLQQTREQKIYSELIEVVEERDKLVAMLEEERVREREEDRDLEQVMRAKGFSLSPIS